jgi:glutathione S-transferase
LRTEQLTVADSSVICQYLERTAPTPAIYPAEATQFARALWLEEFVDGALAPHVLRGLLMERVFARPFLKREPDEAVIRRSLEQELPPKFDYLERNVSGNFLVADQLSIADITVASMLINFHFAGERLRGYPKLERYFHTLLSRPSFQQAFAVELPAAQPLEGHGLDLKVLREALK